MSLDPDPLATPGFMDEGEPPRHPGCSVLPYLVLLILVALAAAGGAGQPTPLDPALVPAAGAADVWAVGNTAGRFPEPSHGGSPSHLPVVASAAREPIASVPAPSDIGTAIAGRSGTWAYAKASHGPRYLAIPEGPGYIVEVCGPLACFERVSTDAGPALYLQRAGRIGDLSSVDFIEACGSLSAGLCSGSYSIILGGPTAPPTNIQEGTHD